jgi:hypothetical protein
MDCKGFLKHKGALPKERASFVTNYRFRIHFSIELNFDPVASYNLTS